MKKIFASSLPLVTSVYLRFDLLNFAIPNRPSRIKFCNQNRQNRYAINLVEHSQK